MGGGDPQEVVAAGAGGGEAEEVGNVPKSAGPKQHSAQGMPITFEGLTYTVKAKKEQLTILDNLSGIFEPGKMTALMGPSGSGKTTLMDVLAGRKNTGKITGEVLYGGVVPPRSALSHLCGYVEQFDTLVGELTVEQMLMYTAELKLPGSTPSAEKKARVEEVIQTLKLESCRGSVIGNALRRGISGGQAKRVNIALALITRPRVIFLDEPTSGLDSRMANEVIVFLRELAMEGRTVVCTIHSPTGFAFERFDDLVMLQPGGRLIYRGPVNNVRGYLGEQGFKYPEEEGYALPEWLVDITTTSASDQDGEPATPGGHGQDFAAIYERSGQSEKNRRATADRAAELKSQPLAPSDLQVQKPGQLRALKTQLAYRMLTHYRSGEFIGPRFGDKIMFSLFILTLYWQVGEKTDARSIQSTASMLYFIAAMCGYGAAAVVPSLTLDRPLFYRELADGCYKPATYFLSKFIEEALMATITSLVYCIPVYFGVALQGSFLVFVLSYYATTMCGIVLAYMVAALVPTMEAANALLPTWVTINMYFGGLFLLFDTIPVGWKWFSWFSFLRYSWGSTMINQFKDSEPGMKRVFYDETSGQALNVLEFYGMDSGIMEQEWICLAFLAGITFFYAFVGALALTFIRHTSR